MGDLRRNTLDNRYTNSRYGRIQRVDYENWVADIQWEQSGGGQPEVPLGLAFCTPRAVLGGMPEVGTTVLCDFTADNAFNSKAVIANYIPTGYKSGINLRQQIEGKREVPIIETPKFRRKFRKLYPGEIIGSSTQGTDMLLDENASLVDMKGDELRLDSRDQSINQISINNYKITDAARHFDGWVYRAIDESFDADGKLSAQHHAPDTYQPYIYDESLKKRWYRTLRGDKTVDDFIISKDSEFPDYTASPLVEVRSEIRELGTGILPLADQNVEKDFWHQDNNNLIATSDPESNTRVPFILGNIIESVSGTLVGYTPTDILRYGKVLRPQIFTNPDSIDIDIQEIVVPDLIDEVEDNDISPGIALIMQQHGFNPNAYPDPLFKWDKPRIGYGMTIYSNGQQVVQGDVITEELAKEELLIYVKKRVRPSIALIPYFSEMNTSQQGALEAFAYDVGVAFYTNPIYSAIASYLKNKQWKNMRQGFMLYDNAGTSAEAVTKAKRKMEADLWDKAPEKKATTTAAGETKTYAPDYTPVRYQAAAYMWKMPYEYSQTRIYVTKEGHTHLHVGATFQQENCPFEPKIEHPLGAGRSVEANFAGSIKAVVDKNLEREESLDLKTIGKVYFHFGKDDGVPSVTRRNLRIDEYDEIVSGITTPKLTDAEGGEATAKHFSIEGVTDGGISLRVGRTHGRNVRVYEQNGFTSEGDKVDGLDVRDVNRANYPSGDNFYKFHDLNRIAENVPGSIHADPEDKRFGNALNDPNLMATSIDMHTVGSIFTRLGADSANISYGFDTKGGIAGWLGAEGLDNRSISVTMDGGIEANIGRINKSGNSIQAYLNGGIELRVRGNKKGQDIKIIAEGDQDMEFIGEQKIAVKGNLEYKTSVDLIQTAGANMALNVSKNYLANIIGTRAVTIANTPPNNVADKTVIQGGNYEVEIATIGDMKMHTKAGELLFLTQKGDAALKAYINKVVLEALMDSVLIKTPLTKVGPPLSLKYPVVTAATGCILTGGQLPHLFGSPNMKVADNPPGSPIVTPPEI